MKYRIITLVLAGLLAHGCAPIQVHNGISQNFVPCSGWEDCYQKGRTIQPSDPTQTAIDRSGHRYSSHIIQTPQGQFTVRTVNSVTTVYRSGK